MGVSKINKNISSPSEALAFTEDEIESMQNVMTIGWSKTGHLYMRSSSMTISESIYLLEKVKNYILKAEEIA